MNKLKIYKENSFQKETEISLPFSKSISNRALILSFLTNNSLNSETLSKADDTALLQESLNKIKQYQKSDLKTTELELNLKNAGTTYRFLTSLLCLQKGSYILNCSERMKERPISPLVNVLKTIGADISYLQNPGFPPIKIQQSELKLPKEVLNVDISSSSQFLSSVLLISPFLNNNVKIKICGEKYSLPYIRMTLNLMNQFGVKTDFKDDLITVFPYKQNQTSLIEIEKDWSSAAFFYQFAVLNPKPEVFIPDIKLPSIQGDAVLAEIFNDLKVETTEKKTGILLKQKQDHIKNFNFNFKDHPDLAVPIVFTCAKLNVIGKFSGLKNLSLKESNRLNAMEEILALFSYDFRMINDDEAVLINSCRTIETPEENREIEIDTKNDHRLFMASALMSTKKTKLILNYPDTFKKSFPGFLKEIEKLGFVYEIISD